MLELSIHREGIGWRIVEMTQRFLLRSRVGSEVAIDVESTSMSASPKNVVDFLLLAALTLHLVIFAPPAFQFAQGPPALKCGMIDRHLPGALLLQRSEGINQQTSPL